MMSLCLKKRGLTLMETLLVVAVIAVIATMGVTVFSREASSVKAQVTAKQIQGILDAAMSYHAAHNVWPNPYLCTDTNPPVGDDFVTHFIPNQNVMSPYGARICWGYDGGSNIPVQDPTYRLYVAYPATSEQQATDVARYLPNAILTTDPTTSANNPCNAIGTCFVRVEGTMAYTAGGAVGPGETNIYAAGQCNMNSTGVIPAVYGNNTNCQYIGAETPVGATYDEQHYTLMVGDCPAGEEAFVHYSFDGYREPYKQNIYSSNGHYVYSVTEGVNPAELSIDHNNTDCVGTGPAITCQLYINATMAFYNPVTNANEEHPISFSQDPPLAANQPPKVVSGSIGADYVVYCVDPNAGSNAT